MKKKEQTHLIIFFCQDFFREIENHFAHTARNRKLFMYYYLKFLLQIL